VAVSVVSTDVDRTGPGDAVITAKTIEEGAHHDCR
jgi:hypothetical protein